MKQFVAFALTLLSTAFSAHAQHALPNSISVYFTSNSCEISIAEQHSLQQWLSSVDVSNQTFTVTGYADSRSSEQYNLKLSKCRADAIVKYIKNKFNVINIGSAAYGESFPVSKTNLQLNRRVVVAISKPVTQKLKDSIVSHQSPVETGPKLSATDTVVTIKQKLQIDNILFFPDQAVVLPQSQMYLEELSRTLMQFPADDKFEIRGYVNCPPCKISYDTTSTMFKLSRNRAKEVYLWLESLGIPAIRMRYIGMGALNMKFPQPKSETEMRKNMRVEVIVY